ncbi:hypothetical protein FKM82_022860 [Ascaphus truei]
MNMEKSSLFFSMNRRFLEIQLNIQIGKVVFRHKKELKISRVARALLKLSCVNRPVYMGTGPLHLGHTFHIRPPKTFSSRLGQRSQQNHSQKIHLSSRESLRWWDEPF